MVIRIAVDMVTALSGHRRDFSHWQWTRQLGWGDPVGVNGFYAGWEHYCDLLRTEQSFFADQHHRHQHQHEDRESDSDSDDRMGNMMCSIVISYLAVLYDHLLCH